MVESDPDGAVAALLKVSMTNNRSIPELLKALNTIDTTEDTGKATIIDKQMLAELRYLYPQQKLQYALVSYGTDVLYAIVHNVRTLGINPSHAEYIMEPSSLTYSEALAILGLAPKDEVAPVAAELCGVCGRMMLSVVGGACSSCRALLEEYTHFRAYQFYVPINHFNIKKLESLNDVPVDVSFETFRVIKTGSTLDFFPKSPSKPLHLPLPFDEFGRPIID